MNDLSAANSTLAQKILREGPQPFAWFMEQALYNRCFGYYRSGRQRIGRSGDFYTNVSVGTVYGQMLALEIVGMWKALGSPAPFFIVEQGAENGQLAADILHSLEKKGVLESFQYRIVEPDPERQSEQQSRLAGGFEGLVHWVIEPAALDPFAGSVIVNELLDAFPVHAVEFHDGRWLERYVTICERGFDWILGPPSNAELFQAIGKLPTTLSEGYRTEINLECNRWVKAISSKIQKGYILIVDYGFSRDEFYSPERIEGTLRSYFRHRQSHNPLEGPGSRDITAHVEFTSVAESAEQAGCRVAGYTDQHRFMVSVASDYLRELEAALEVKGPTPEQSKFIRGYRTLMHPGTMGMAFKYLLLSKGDVAATNSFQFGSDPRRVLGLEGKCR